MIARAIGSTRPAALAQIYVSVQWLEMAYVNDKQADNSPYGW